LRRRFAVDRDPLRVCLERSIELEGARLRLRDWPGFSGPLVHVPDPLSPGDDVLDVLAAHLAPDYRVLSIAPRPGQPYQIQAVELVATLDQFGFEKPVLLGERLGCVAALLLAAWHPGRVARLVLIHPTYDAPLAFENTIEARSLRDCPPDWPSLRNAVHCPVLELAWTEASLNDLQTFLPLP
jgi:pimeloyl-ACP methyl ester carboxylesterase